MDHDVVDRIQKCIGCAAVRIDGPPEPMLRKSMPDRAWQEVAIDFFSAKEFSTFLVLVDYYSRFLKVVEMRGTNASKTIDVLEDIFAEQTYPETIRSDNGPPFNSEAFANYCVEKNIRLVRTIPYWPQMNGLVERQNQGILRALRIAKATNEDWRKALKNYVYMFNTTPHSMTGKAPLELMTGRPVKDLLPSLKTDPNLFRDEGIREQDLIEKTKGKIYADKRRHAKLSDIEGGDTVMLKNYASGKLESHFKLEKFTVVERNGTDTVVRNDEGITYHRPVSHLRKWPSQSDQETISEQVSKKRIRSDSISDSSSSSEAGTSQTGQYRQPGLHSDAMDLEDTLDEPIQTSSRPKRKTKLPSRFSS
ncbi:uncharacterized protein K02A2.6-like [Uranotaenia lowii]|uniref:uncharacterized protein K02A2.6-like n=1 Tax=Uranotaenia lowii TaxID=190385 RepID=UPI0024785E69|nr:uncharacterized protein K02A2.6-like [Uranotaenia lowii]